ncbi:MAG TPA: hypothetical protein DCQ90_10805 [Erysipelotrichaceae bacterium]|jgi:hypothetical protein|nr:hypothetical protein [Erysipelotrichaceae bacterium]OGS58412.1 MAG: hypothetical protein A2Y19_08760 [Firmicutes bacterium GWE2_51_13]HAO62360.1 hypothetical protein [Erysipelotrichaceae bacterium]HBZ40952.1 hypothetical protein [Erysipelotrichaceae bacterium]
MKKLLLLISILALTTACSSDVLKREANQSFSTILEIDLVETMVEEGYAHVKVAEGYHIDFALDTSASEKDVLMAFMAMPFIEAGLDVNALPSTMFLNEDMLVFSTNLNDAKSGTDAKTQLANLLDANRDSLGYHEELDHFGLTLGSNKFEWAKTSSTNDKDVVFVLDAESLRDLGVDVASVEGWTLATMDGVELLLKPFKLD